MFSTKLCFRMYKLYVFVVGELYLARACLKDILCGMGLQEVFGDGPGPHSRVDIKSHIAHKITLVGSSTRDTLHKYSSYLLLFDVEPYAKAGFHIVLIVSK